MKTFSKLLLSKIENKYKKENIEPKPGEFLKISYSIKNSEKVAFFEGIVIGVQNKGIAKSFILRKIVKGHIIDQNFFLHSPNITILESTASLKQNRSKLYFIKKYK